MKIFFICFGIALSLLIFKFNGEIYLLLFIPELISLVYALKNSDLLKMKFAKTMELLETIKKFFQLGFVSLLTNIMNYFDRFLIYPIFGTGYVAMYYAVNSMSKVASLITNPMASVILSWVSNNTEKSNKFKILSFTILSNIPVLFLVTLVTIPCTYIALIFLYPEYVHCNEALVLIIPISLTTAFGTATTLIKSVLLKYSNTNKLVFTYFVYIILFMILGYFLSKSSGLKGFTIANLISKIILWGLFIVLLISSKKESTNENVREN